MRRVIRVLLVGRRKGWRAAVRRRFRLFTWLDREPGRDPRPHERVTPKRPSAPSGFVAVMEKDTLKPGEVAEVMANGVAVALANVDGQYFAVHSVCPHAGGPLGDGSLDGHTLTCPLHGWSYDVRDGKCFVDAETKLRTYSVRVTDQAICVEQPM